MNRRKEIFILFAGFFSIFIFSVTITSILLFSSWIYALVIGALWYFISIIIAFYILNSTRRIVNVRMCWIFVILGIPILGLSIFLLFGINPLIRLRQKTYLQHQEELTQFENFEFSHKYFQDPNQDINYRQIFRYGYNCETRPVYQNNDIQVIENQSHLFRESIKLIRSAKLFIHLQYYIISDSVWMRTIANELIKKARTGVRVRFIYDWVGSYKRDTQKIIKKLKEAGIIVAIFNPKTVTRYTSKTNFRCHRKCLIVDNHTAIYGGSNLGDEYIRLAPNIINWEDSNIVVKGQVVNTLNLLFCLDWGTYCEIGRNQKHLDDLKENRKKYFPKYEVQHIQPTIAQVIEKSPNYDSFELSGLLSTIIARAKKRIWIVTPYFIPTDSIIEALKVASLSGVDVRIIVPGLPDDKKYILTINRFHYDRMLNSNIKIFEYNGFIHSKLILIDDAFVSIGTFNFDFRSLYINYESALLVKDNAIASQYEKVFKNYLRQSSLININTFTPGQKRIIRFKMAFMNAYHPLL